MIKTDSNGSVLPISTSSVLRGLVLLGGVLTVGTIGYMVIEKWQFLDSLYMTVITITTVGFGEINRVSQGGRIFTTVLIFFGMGIMAYTLGLVAQAMIELQLRSILGRRKLGTKIKSIKNHYIICGCGRIGRIISRELLLHEIPLVVIDSNEESEVYLEQKGIPYIIDDATQEEVLLKAGIERAKGLVSVVSSDADNVYIIISARGLNPDLFILSRADEENSQKKFFRAGANRVVMPYLIGGQKMAQTIVKPAVSDFLECTFEDENIELKMEELLVEEGSKLDGVALLDSGIRQDTNVIVIGISKKNGKMKFNPSSDARIEGGDTLIALGDSTDLEKLESILAAK